jgi:hypothetical protein
MARPEDELEGFLTDESRQPHLNCQRVAVRVAELLLEFNALDYWREMVRVAWAEADQRDRQLAAWQQKRLEFFRQEATKQSRRRSAGRLTVPPTENFPLETEEICLRDGRKVQVSACPPPELGLDERPPIGSLLPLRWPLSIAGCYTILAAIHDATLKGVEPINPWKAARNSTPLSRGIQYHILLDKTKELHAREAASLEVALVRVEEDLQACASKPKTRGNPRMTPERLAKHRDIKERWKQAKGAGVSKDQFCKDQHVSRKTLETALRTCRKKDRET